jgi:hypothetical protein
VLITGGEPPRSAGFNLFGPLKVDYSTPPSSLTENQLERLPMTTDLTRPYSRDSHRFFFFLTVLMCLLPAMAQDFKPKMEDILKDTQKIVNDDGGMTIVWWVPLEFWQASFERNPNVTKIQAAKFLDVLRPYTVVVVMESKIGPLGGMTFKPESEIRRRLTILDGTGKSYSPLDEDSIDADARNFVTMMKPVLGSSMGSFGKNCNFYIFPARDKNGGNIVDPKSEGLFKVALDPQEYAFRLPLGSLLPPHKCPKCGENLNGAYKFCPFDGTALTKQP